MCTCYENVNKKLILQASVIYHKIAGAMTLVLSVDVMSCMLT